MSSVNIADISMKELLKYSKFQNNMLFIWKKKLILKFLEKPQENFEKSQKAPKTTLHLKKQQQLQKNT